MDPDPANKDYAPLDPLSLFDLTGPTDGAYALSNIGSLPPTAELSRPTFNHSVTGFCLDRNEQWWNNESIVCLPLHSFPSQNRADCLFSSQAMYRPKDLVLTPLFLTRATRYIFSIRKTTHRLNTLYSCWTLLRVRNQCERRLLGSRYCLLYRTDCSFSGNYTFPS
jgi:hypothetical protein